MKLVNRFHQLVVGIVPNNWIKSREIDKRDEDSKD